MVYAGTSWEGVRWRVPDPRWRETAAGFGPKMIAMMTSTLMPVLAPVLVVAAFFIFAAPAQAHGGSCGVRAYNPYEYNYGNRIAGFGRAYCNGYGHTLTVRVYKDLRYRPDPRVGIRSRYGSGTFGTTASGGHLGSGRYYTDARVRWHSYDQSGRVFLRR